MLYHLAYVSTPKTALSYEAMQALEAAAAEENRRCGVTGILLRRQSMIIQILEGSRSALDHVMGRIRADHRHEHIELLFDEPLAARDFGGCPFHCIVSDDFAANRAA